MAPLRNIRKSRRLSHMPPMEAADYDWEGAASRHLLHSGSDIGIAPTVPLAPPSPSSCTTSSSNSPPPMATHLPFAPGSSHTRNRKEGHIPRPPNAFMVFRSWLWNKDNLKSVERDNRNVSRIAGRYWNELSEAERAPFRRMAEEAKARHAQLYPDYRYLPSSQKRPKVAHRRPRQDGEDENEKCKKLADLLLGGIVGRDLAKYLEEGKKEPQVEKAKEEESFSAPVFEQTSMKSLRSAPQKASKSRKGPSSRQLGSTRKAKAAPRPTPAPHSQLAPLPIHPMTQMWSETAETPGLFIDTPELQYPLDDDQFVPTNDIPYLSLDSCKELIIKRDAEDFNPPIIPSHLLPGAYSPFAGIKPEAIQFADSCMFGAYTAGMQAPLTPMLSPNLEFESYSAHDPLDSPVYFSNPFEESSLTAARSAMLISLDQLFGQSISPLTPLIPSETW